MTWRDKLGFRLEGEQESYVLHDIRSSPGAPLIHATHSAVPILVNEFTVLM